VTDLDLSASDIRALRGLCQRGGGPLSKSRAERFVAAGLAAPHPHYHLTYPEAPAPHYCLTGKGRVLLHNRGKLPRATGT
jgi:hypothetical protein